MGRRPRSLEERFWKKVDKSAGPDGCWLWTAHKDKDGYGQISIDTTGKQDQAHRISLSWKLGRPLKDGCVSMHSECDNPPCVNPAHLEEGTVRKNNEDRAAKGRSAYGDKNGMRVHKYILAGERNGNAKFSDAQAETVRKYHGLLTQIELATLFDVTDSSIWKIVHGHTYKGSP